MTLVVSPDMILKNNTETKFSQQGCMPNFLILSALHNDGLEEMSCKGRRCTELRVDNVVLKMIFLYLLEIFILCIYFGFWATPGGTQGLLLVLLFEITLGRLTGPYEMTGKKAGSIPHWTCAREMPYRSATASAPFRNL